MNIEVLNQLANDILVARIEIAQLESELAQKMEELGLNAIQNQIDGLKQVRDLHQSQLMGLMKDNNLKSWKTNEASYSKAERVTFGFKDYYKKAIEERLKGGEEIEGWEKRVTEYVSIRPNK